MNKTELIAKAKLRLPDVEYDVLVAPIPDEECFQTAYEVRGLLTKTKGVNRA